MIKIRKKGFTLVELIITIAVMAIIVPVILNVFNYYNKLQHTISDKLELQNNMESFKNSIYKDLRKAVTTTDSVLVDGQWEFSGSDMSNNNDYCKLKGYRPLIFMDKIDDSESYYVYDSIEKQIKKIDIPFDETTITVTKYFPTNLTLDSTNTGTDWDIISDDHIPDYQSRAYNITDDVITKGLSISCDTSDDSIANPIKYTSFTIIGAFQQDAANNFVVLKSNTPDSSGKTLWFIVKIDETTLIYYVHTTETLISDNIDPDGSFGGINISYTSNSSGNGSETKTYSIDVNGKLKNETKNMSIRVSTIDYGGVIN